MRPLALVHLAARDCGILDLEPARLDISSLAFQARVFIKEADGYMDAIAIRVGEPHSPGGPLVVSEHPVGNRFPRACPCRHINGDGTFCMGLEGVDDWLCPTTVQEASLWWQHVRGYLELQKRADHVRRWDRNHEWGHGAVGNLEVLQQQLLQAVPQEVLTHLLSAGTTLSEAASTWVQNDRRCPCGSGRRFRYCHAPHVKRLLAVEKEIEVAEASFWRDWQGTQCCGTMDDCPLRGSVAHQKLQLPRAPVTHNRRLLRQSAALATRIRSKHKHKEQS